MRRLPSTSASGHDHIVFVLLGQMFLSGCVGFAVSVSGPIVTKQIPTADLYSEGESLLPRKAEIDEVVVCDIANKEIRYETGNFKSKCMTFVFVYPIYHGDCSRIETWSYQNPDQITVETHAHRIVGIWCSPIPYAAIIPLLDNGIKNTGDDVRDSWNSISNRARLDKRIDIVRSTY